MTCREAEAFLDAYLDGELAPDAREAFERHLEVCTNCRAYLATYAATIRLARRALADSAADAASAMPEDLVDAILSSVRASKAGH